MFELHETKNSFLLLSASFYRSHPTQRLQIVFTETLNFSSSNNKTKSHEGFSLQMHKILIEAIKRLKTDFYVNFST
jgi:hypothetical protein